MFQVFLQIFLQNHHTFMVFPPSIFCWCCSSLPQVCRLTPTECRKSALWFFPCSEPKWTHCLPSAHRPSLSMASVSDNCITILPLKHILLHFLASKLNQFENPLSVIFSIFIATWLKLFPSFLLHCFILPQTLPLLLTAIHFILCGHVSIFKVPLYCIIPFPKFCNIILKNAYKLLILVFQISHSLASSYLGWGHCLYPIHMETSLLAKLFLDWVSNFFLYPEHSMGIQEHLALGSQGMQAEPRGLQGRVCISWLGVEFPPHLRRSITNKHDAPRADCHHFVAMKEVHLRKRPASWKEQNWEI